MKKSIFASVLCSIILAGTVAINCDAATDKSICGTWRTVIRRPGSPEITVTWTIEPSGNYKVVANGQSENGKMTTEGNRYMKTTNIGPDNGTYQVLSDQKFSTNGRWGYTEWTRVGGGGTGKAFNSAANAVSSMYNKYKAQATGGSYGGGESGGGVGQHYGAAGQNYDQYQTKMGYDPNMNPRSAGWAKMGFGSAGTTQDQSGWRPNQGGGDPGLQSADLKSLLFSNFPIKSGGDEVEQFGLPALGKAAAGGMRKREFRLIQ